MEEWQKEEDYYFPASARCHICHVCDSREEYFEYDCMSFVRPKLGWLSNPLHTNLLILCRTARKTHRCWVFGYISMIEKTVGARKRNRK